MKLSEFRSSHSNERKNDYKLHVGYNAEDSSRDLISSYSSFHLLEWWKL